MKRLLNWKHLTFDNVISVIAAAIMFAIFSAAWLHGLVKPCPLGRAMVALVCER